LAPKIEFFKKRFSPSSATGGGENGDSGGAITDEAIQKTIDSLVRFIACYN
jgi:hypothetical protein